MADNTQLTNKIKRQWTLPRKTIVPPDQMQLAAVQTPLDTERIRAIIQTQAIEFEDAEGQLELLPDLRLAMEIYCSTILSPKDLTEVSLNFNVPEGSPEGTAEIIKKYFTNNFNLLQILPTILEQTLFKKGSYSLLVLPVQSICELIQKYNNVTEKNDFKYRLGFENLSESIGIENLGLLNLSNIKSDLSVISLENFKSFNAEYSYYEDAQKLTEKNAIISFDKFAKNYKEINKTKLGLESKDKIIEDIEISDNPLHLLTPFVLEHSRKSNVKNILKNKLGMTLGMETITNVKEVKSPYSATSTQYTNFVRINSHTKEENKHHLEPIIINIDSSSILPVFPPGEPENHIGYFIAIDIETGSPVRGAPGINRYKELNRRLDQTVAFNAGIMNSSISTSLNYVHYAKPVEQMSDTELSAFSRPIVDAYIKNFEDQLVKSVKQGNYGIDVEVGQIDEIYRLMFYRQLYRQKTRLVYVPVEMLEYFAFEYNAIGVGQSLLKKTRMIAGLRATLMFANLMNSIRNSITGTELNIALDDNDPNPLDTIEKTINAYAAMQTSRLPLLASISAPDIVDSLQKSATTIKVTGGQFANTNIELVERQRQISKPDTDTEVLLRNSHYAGIGLSPEQIDKSQESEYATGIAYNNILQSKRILVKQNKINIHIASFVRKVIDAGGKLYEDLLAKFNEAEDSAIDFEEFVAGITAVLPKPDSAVHTAQFEAYKSYSEFMEEAINLYFSEEMIKDLLKDESDQFLPDSIAAIKESIKTYLKRNYLRKHNMLPELDELISNDNGILANSIEKHHESIINLLADINLKIKDVEHKSIKKLQEQQNKLQEEANANNEENNSEEGNDEGEENTEGSNEKDVNTDPVDGESASEPTETSSDEISSEKTPRINNEEPVEETTTKEEIPEESNTPEEKETSSEINPLEETKEEENTPKENEEETKETNEETNKDNSSDTKIETSTKIETEPNNTSSVKSAEDVKEEKEREEKVKEKIEKEKQEAEDEEKKKKSNEKDVNDNRDK